MSLYDWSLLLITHGRYPLSSCLRIGLQSTSRVERRRCQKAFWEKLEEEEERETSKNLSELKEKQKPEGTEEERETS